MYSPCICATADCGHAHHEGCYCNEDQSAGYTYQDEYGECDFCLGLFIPGTKIGNDEYNEPIVCHN